MNCINSSPIKLKSSAQIKPVFSWQEIDTVFLDLDGTLLDKYFDDYFWEHHVPLVFAEKNSLNQPVARERLLAIYRSVENTLQWTDLDYWSTRLDLDIAYLKKEISHLVNVLPYAADFLEYLHAIGKKVYLITNAHPKALHVKMEKVKIERWFQRIICSQEIGLAKEQPPFWDRLQSILPFDKNATLFADDTEKVLQSAETYGIRHLIHVANPSSKLTPRHSMIFPSILSFHELMF